MKKLLPILSLALLAATAFADDAAMSEVDSTYFHPAASLYIQGDTAGASNLVAKGLSIYPDNGKLKRLEELLKKQQKKDQQNKNNQKNKDQNKKKDQDKKKNQDKNQDQKKNQQNKDQQKKDQNKNQQNQDKSKNQQQDQQHPEPQPSTEQMSKDEAKQLLDAMKQEEKNKRLQLHPVMGAPVKVDKDW